jgi:N-acyl-D-amino-acid deacylase
MAATRRRFLSTSGMAVLGSAALRLPRIEAAPVFDLLLRGGSIFDGTGGPPFTADVGITGDAIAALGAISPEQGRRVLDVTDLSVAPGFVDIHSHSDRSIVVHPTADSRVRQGITTEITGNCGSSAAPLAGENAEEVRRWMGGEDELRPDWTDVASYGARLEREKISVNQALLLGQGTIRQAVAGNDDRPLTSDEMTEVLRLVEEGLDQGAWGMSTGLEYTPGRYTPTDEIVAMARLVARRGGLYASHIRNEEATLLESVAEAIAIGRRSGARVEVSHLKAAGRVNWDKQGPAIALIEAARREGVGVLADAYPYGAYSTGLTILFQNWALEGDTAALMARLADPATRERIRREVAVRVPQEPGGYDLIVISSVKTPGNQALVGKNMLQVAETWSVDADEAVVRLIQQESGQVSYVGHAMSAENVDRVLSHPLVMIGSDGYAVAPTGRAVLDRPHPRSYGAYARVLQHYVRERKVLDLAGAVRKMTSMPADQAGLRDRGRVAKGLKADLVVFDPTGVTESSTFENPQRYPTGIPHVVVNGVLVVEAGAHTGARPGRMLRRG